MPSPFTPFTDFAQDFVSFLSNAYSVTTEYGAPVAAGPEKGKPHYAVDFGTPKGTPLFSMGSGIVLRPTDVPGHTSTTGKDDAHTVTVDYGHGVLVQFAHLDKVFVKPGDKVAPGDWLANTGDAGISSGAHLHVDAWRDGRKIDVRELIDPISHFTDYEKIPGATAGSIPILGPLTGGARGAADAALSWTDAVAQFFGALINPETWARVLAILAGAILTMIGGYMLWQST